MKKSISVLLAILLTMATILSGCGGGNSSATSPSGMGASTDDSSEQELLPDMRVLIDALEAAFCDYAGSTPYFEEEQFGDEWFVYVYPEEGGETIEIYHIDARGKITDFTEETVTLDDFHVRDEVLAKLRDSNSTSEEETAEPSDPAEDSNLEWETNTWTITDLNGYSVDFTVSYSPFMLYDNELLADYWNNVNSNEPFPDKQELHDSLIGSLSGTPNDMYCAVGTISAKNVTEGWDFTQENHYSGGFQLCLYHPFNGNLTNLCSDRYGFPAYMLDNLPFTRVFYGSGYKDINGSNSEDGLLVIPKWTSNEWGPVAFVMVLPENITPNYPQGQYRPAYEKEECYFSLSFSLAYHYDILFNGSESAGNLPIEFAD